MLKETNRVVITKPDQLRENENLLNLHQTLILSHTDVQPTVRAAAHYLAVSDAAPAAPAGTPGLYTAHSISNKKE